MSDSVKKWVSTSSHGGMVAAVSNDYAGTYVRYEDYAQLTAELEAVRRDAERYRYLRDKSGDVTTGPFIGIGHQCKQCDWTCGEDADAAIDAAIGQTVALVPVPVKEG